MFAMRQILLGPRGGVALPYDAEVEYIRSSRREYINTQYIGHTDTRFELDASFDVNTGQIGNVYSARQEKPYFALASLGGFFLGTQTTSTEAYPFFEYSSARRIYGYNAATGLCICGTEQATGYPLLTDQVVPMYLFARNNGANRPGLYCKMSIYGFRCWYDSQLVLDLIPVRLTNEQNQSEGAMYDRVSGELFRNAGTGAFTIGPDKS